MANNRAEDAKSAPQYYRSEYLRGCDTRHEAIGETTIAAREHGDDIREALRTVYAYEPLCSICREPVGESAGVTIQHVVTEHPQSDEFQEFVEDVRAVGHCRVCGDRFESDIEHFRDGIFGARVCCPDCRDDKPTLRSLMTDEMYIRELLARGFIANESGAEV